MDTLVIAVDPGREKCGIAVMEKHAGVLYKKVIATKCLVSVVQELVNRYLTTTIVLGDRTSSRAAKESLAKVSLNTQPVMILFVDEHHSTDEARRRYWCAHPPCGLMRFIPTTLQVPPVPVDDYVAIILAERYFANH